ncbi:MAG: TIGR02186 family protein [Deltaproteobacteria bacterium]|nr:TIGR02186 family protein [Deltaproteobacteria bacterium]
MLNKTMHETRTTLLLTGLALLSLFFSRPAQALTCRVSPDKVPIGLNYHGATLAVSGENKAGDDMIIRITNDKGEAHYKYIGKAGGLVWMKKGDVSFTNVPGVYLLFSSGDLEHLLGSEERQANQIGYDAMKEAAEMETGSPELQGASPRWKDEFIRFKEKQKLYAIHPGAVTRQHGRDSDTYQLEVAWPYQAGPGTYSVEAMAVRDGKVVEREQTRFTVQQAGVVKQLSGLAFNNASIYGIMAVLIAIFAGFAVGMIFRKGGGGAH